MILISSAFIGACGGNTPAPNNAPAVNNGTANVAKTNVNSPVAVATATPAATTNDAPTLTPVYKAFCAAFAKKDETAIRKVYSAETLKNFEEQMKDGNIKTLIKFLEDDDPAGACSVKNEVITGDKAVGELVAGAYPNGFKIVFVKENGEWKMTNQSPTFDAVKPSTSDSGKK